MAASRYGAQRVNTLPMSTLSHRPTSAKNVREERRQAILFHDVIRLMLTQWGLVMQYGVRDVGQHLFR